MATVTAKVCCFVLSGPQGSGLSQRAHEIAELLGATRIIEEWDGRSPVPEGALAVTNCAVSIDQYPPSAIGSGPSISV